MPGNYPWAGSPYSAEAKRRSMRQTQDMLDALREERERGARYCGCGEPVRVRRYLGWWLCALCQRLIERPEVEVAGAGEGG